MEESVRPSANNTGAKLLAVVVFMFILVSTLLYIAFMNQYKTPLRASLPKPTSTFTNDNSPTPISSYKNPFNQKGSALAQNITYPIPELSNCGDANECYHYCEIPQNTPACWSYDTYILNGKVLGEATENNPYEQGKCDSESTCRAYCQNHPGECKGFSATSGDTRFSGSYTSGNYLGPDGCKTKEKCKNYCQAHPSQCPGFKATPTPATPTPGLP